MSRPSSPFVPTDSSYYATITSQHATRSTASVLRAAGPSASGAENHERGRDPSNNDHSHLEDDISRRLSISKDRAISALSQPVNGGGAHNSDTSKDTNGSGRPSFPNSPRSPAKSMADNQAKRSGPSSTLLPPPIATTTGGGRNSSFKGNGMGRNKNRNHNTNKSRRRNNNNQNLSSQDSAEASTKSSSPRHRKGRNGDSRKRPKSAATGGGSRKTNSAASSESLPSYSSLLPPPLTNAKSQASRTKSSGEDSAGQEDEEDSLSSGLSSWEEFLGVGGSVGNNLGSRGPSSKFSSSNRATNPTLDSSFPRNRLQNRNQDESEAVPDRLPAIHDLFPPDLSSSPPPVETSKSTSSSDKSKSWSQSSLDGVLPVSDLFYRSSSASADDDGEDHDDEELPFSAEQSDSVTSNNNKVHIRRNLAQKPKASKQEMSRGRSASDRKKSGGRKMIRRGMEMLVGGVPINADPPQRSIELSYDASCKPDDWASVISLNTLDFGPLVHTSSIPYVTNVEEGLYCEHFCHSTMKWDICPKDLREVVKSHSLQLAQSKGAATEKEQVQAAVVANSTDSTDPQVDEDDEDERTHDEEDDEFNVAMSIVARPMKKEESDTLFGEGDRRTRLSKAKGFGKQETSKTADTDEKQFFDAKTELLFELSVSREELVSGSVDGEEEDYIFRDVLARAFLALVVDRFKGFTVAISKLVLTDKGDGSTSIDVEFQISNEKPMTFTQAQKRLKVIGASFVQGVDEGDMQVAIAAAATVEKRWPEAVRQRVYEECLFEDDDIDGQEDSVDNEDRGMDDSVTRDNEEELKAEKDSALEPRGDLYIGGGDDGVFPDYSESNLLQSPYKGEIGLRLVDAVVQRAKERQPRVIAIGDVHGCIDELQDLLRQCDYRPGDLIVFLGDLVCKGPDSISVVQMAREIGAIGVRGNHDFEVIR